MPNSSSFTLAAAGIVHALITECAISQGYSPASGNPMPEPVVFNGIWDTGATASVITQKVVDELGLKPTGMTYVQGVHGVSAVETYLVNVYLPNQVGIQHVQVTKGNLGGYRKCLDRNGYYYAW